MSLLLMSAVVSSIGCIVLAIYALKFNPKNSANRYFAFLALSIAIWVIVFYWSLVDFQMWLIKATLMFAAIWVYTLYFLAIALAEKKMNWITKVVTIASFVLCILLLLSPYSFSGVQSVNGFPMPIPNFGLYICNAFLLSILLYSFFLLYKLYSSSDHVLASMRSRFILLSFCFSFTFTAVSIVVSIFVLNSQKYLPVALFSMLVFVFSGYYAMTRYRFLSVKIILRKSLIYGFALFIAISVYSLFLLLLLDWLSLPFLYVILFMSLLLFLFFRSTFKTRIDGVFFNDEIDFARRVMIYQSRLQATQNIKDYINRISNDIAIETNLQLAHFYILFKPAGRFLDLLGKGSKKFFSENDPVVMSVAKLDRGYTIDELIDNSCERQFVKWLRSNKIEAVVPITDETGFFAFLALSIQKDGSYPSTKDYQFIDSLVGMAKQHLPVFLRWQNAVEYMNFDIE